MRNLKKQRRLQVILLSIGAIAIASALIGYGFQDGINFFRSPTQVVMETPPPGEVFRIGGLVLDGSLQQGRDGVVSFWVTDGNESIAVRFSGILPDLFREGEGVVGLGTYDGAVFTATEILAKHDETYMPKEVIEALKEQGVFRTSE